ncbi:LysR family transcriptional regulator [Streptomyces sp. NPDC047971]|uniref:LysR family transcriptional regulator n=1 Tax=Streptomyces sp. NPDC047971 TaxID=3154499 RepID=UPI0033EBD2FB
MLERLELEAFLTLAEELHFGRTAERLHVTKSRISQTIKRLERRVGAALFTRNSRSVALTDVGRRLRDDLSPAYERIGLGLARAIAAGRGERARGVLRVGWSAPWCGNLVVRAADLLRARHPDCEVETGEIQLCDPLGRLRAGTVDVQLTAFPVVEPDIVTGRSVFAEPRALMVPADHPFAMRESVSLEDLADCVLVTLADAHVPRYWMDRHFPRRTPAGRPIPQGPATNYWSELLVHVATGAGVSPVAARAERFHARPGLAFVPLRDAPTVDYGLMWPAAGRNPLLLPFLDVVDELAPSAVRSGPGGANWPCDCPPDGGRAQRSADRSGE